MAKAKSLKIPLLVLLSIILIICLGFVLQSRFTPPRSGSQAVDFTIGKNFTLDAVVADLKYFDFIKDETAFRYALKYSKDNTPGNDNSLKIGNNTIDREARYTISQSMTAWEIAKILLNQGKRSACNHGCPDSNFTPELLPGGDLAPTLKQKYEWVKTYEGCVNSIGHDGGQLSSEQSYERTGVRFCTSPDGRYFKQGEEGWSDQPIP